MKNVKKSDATDQKHINPEDEALQNVTSVLLSTFHDGITSNKASEREKSYSSLMEFSLNDFSLPNQIFFLFIQAQYWNVKWVKGGGKKDEWLVTASKILDEAMDLCPTDLLWTHYASVTCEILKVKLLLYYSNSASIAKKDYLDDVKGLIDLLLTNHPADSSLQAMKKKLSTI